MLQTSTQIRSPLSVGLCENNIISSNDSPTSGAVIYRYDEANRCERLTVEAEQIFRQRGVQSKEISSWKIYAIVTGVGIGVAAVMGRLSSYGRLLIPVALIGMVFLLIVCLPKLIQGTKEMKRLQEADISIHRQVDEYFNVICDRINAHNGVRRFFTAETDILPNVEINQELLNDFDQWIDTLRLIHGWSRLKEVWLTAAPNGQFDDTEEWNLRYKIARILNCPIDNLRDIVRGIELSRDHIYRTINPQTDKESNDTNVMVEVCRLSLGGLLGSIQSLERRREEIQQELSNLHEVYNRIA